MDTKEGRSGRKATKRPATRRMLLSWWYLFTAAVISSSFKETHCRRRTSSRTSLQSVCLIEHKTLQLLIEPTSFSSSSSSLLFPFPIPSTTDRPPHFHMKSFVTCVFLLFFPLLKIIYYKYFFISCPSFITFLCFLFYVFSVFVNSKKYAFSGVRTLSLPRHEQHKAIMDVESLPLLLWLDQMTTAARRGTSIESPSKDHLTSREDPSWHFDNVVPPSASWQPFHTASFTIPSSLFFPFSSVSTVMLVVVFFILYTCVMNL